MASDMDLAVEKAVREYLAGATPEVGFLGEEEGARAGDGELSWVLDPIDGTVNYVHGVPLWGISLGLISGESQLLGPQPRGRYLSMSPTTKNMLPRMAIMSATMVLGSISGRTEMLL
jgi:fructose-1,6-bisphosphatase/inositol monophosphatase family enzyme